MRILLSGYLGHMGKEVRTLCEKGCRGAQCVGGVDAFATGEEAIPCAATFKEAMTDADCVVDFSHHDMTLPLLDFCMTNKLPLVLATTGQTESEKEAIQWASDRIPLFFAANYSLGIALLIELAKKTAQVMGDAEIEIIEAHHDRKLDAPSGTALAIANAIKEVRSDAQTVCGRNGMGKRTQTEIGVHAVRMGNIVGMHEVLIGTNNQTITLKHEAHSRALFAEGALAAAQFLVGKKPGLYNMKDMVRL